MGSPGFSFALQGRSQSSMFDGCKSAPPRPEPQRQALATNELRTSYERRTLPAFRFLTTWDHCLFSKPSLSAQSAQEAFLLGGQSVFALQVRARDQFCSDPTVWHARDQFCSESTVFSRFKDGPRGPCSMVAKAPLHAQSPKGMR